LIEEGTAMSQQKSPPNRGRRQVKDITIETYTSQDRTDDASLLKSGCGKQVDVGDCNKKQPDEKKNNVVDLRLEPITFLSGNPLIEVTKGILHLYKEE